MHYITSQLCIEVNKELADAVDQLYQQVDCHVVYLGTCVGPIVLERVENIDPPVGESCFSFHNHEIDVV